MCAICVACCHSIFCPYTPLAEKPADESSRQYKAATPGVHDDAAAATLQPPPRLGSSTLAAVRGSGGSERLLVNFASGMAQDDDDVCSYVERLSDLHGHVTLCCRIDPIALLYHWSANGSAIGHTVDDMFDAKVTLPLPRAVHPGCFAGGFASPLCGSMAVARLARYMDEIALGLFEILNLGLRLTIAMCRTIWLWKLAMAWHCLR